MGATGVRKRRANAEEGAPSATAASTAQDRIELVSIFFTLTGELRPCWQALARRVNDTSAPASEPRRVGLAGQRRGWTARAHGLTHSVRTEIFQYQAATGRGSRRLAAPDMSPIGGGQSCMRRR